MRERPRGSRLPEEDSTIPQDPGCSRRLIILSILSPSILCPGGPISKDGSIGLLRPVACGWAWPLSSPSREQRAGGGRVRAFIHGLPTMPACGPFPAALSGALRSCRMMDGCLTLPMQGRITSPHPPVFLQQRSHLEIDSFVKLSSVTRFE